MCFVASPVGNVLLGLIPGKFRKFDIFPGESSRPHWMTETGCINKCNMMKLPEKVNFRAAKIQIINNKKETLVSFAQSISFALISC